jgi:hypothetical protein
LSVECLGCICEAISGCNRTLTCGGEVCGLFRITWAYWSDAGKPVLQGDNAAADGGKMINNCHAFATLNVFLLLAKSKLLQLQKKLKIKKTLCVEKYIILYGLYI